MPNNWDIHCLKMIPWENTSFGELFVDFHKTGSGYIVYMVAKSNGRIFRAHAKRLLEPNENDCSKLVVEYMKIFDEEKSIMDDLGYECVGYGNYQFKDLALIEKSVFLYENDLKREFELIPSFRCGHFASPKEAILSLGRHVSFDELPSKVRDLMVCG